jgi:Mrp family chromosome partitioning ATPase
MPSNQELRLSRHAPTLTGLPEARPSLTGLPQASLPPSGQGSPVVFVDPPDPAQTDEALVMLHDRDSSAAAGFRSLARQLAARRVLITTSAGPGEGKSVAAANLAVALAERGQCRVLLVDAHFARPALGSLFGLQARRCFAEQLDDHRAAPASPWVVQRVAASELAVLPVASGTERTLDRQSFAAATQQFARTFDHLVIDAGPALEGAGIDLIQDLADALILVARTGHTRARALRAVIERVSPAPVAGVLLLD